MGMPAPPNERPAVPALPPGEVWTADRVRRELIDENRPTPRYEFIGGEVLVSPSPAYLHLVALRELFGILQPYLATQRVGEVLWSPSDVEVAPNTTAQPDLYVIPRDEGERLLRIRRHEPARRLLLAVEILSPSSVRNDRLKKRRHYVGSGVEYWVVDLDARVIERNAPGDAKVDLHDEHLAWHPDGATEPLVLDVVDYFRRVLGADAAEDAVTR
jgi:Uma2 family endonuclease